MITSLVRLLTDQPQIKLYGIRPKEDTFKLRREPIDREEVDAHGIRTPGFLLFRDFVWDEEDETDQPVAGDEGLVEVPNAE